MGTLEKQSTHPGTPLREKKERTTKKQKLGGSVCLLLASLDLLEHGVPRELGAAHPLDLDGGLLAPDLLSLAKLASLGPLGAVL